MRGGNRKGVGHKPFELELGTDLPIPGKPEPGQDNETFDRRSEPIPTPQPIWTIADGLGRTGTRIAALLAEFCRLQLVEDEAKKLSRRSNKPEKKTR